MTNKFDEMREAIREARTVLSAADSVASDLAGILAADGRLRRVGSVWALTELKRQLRDFNIHTGRWKK